MSKPLVTPGAKKIQNKNSKPKDTEEKNDEKVVSYKFYYGQLHGHTAYSLQTNNEKIDKNKYQKIIGEYLNKVASKDRRELLKKVFNVLTGYIYEKTEDQVPEKERIPEKDRLYPHAYGFPDNAYNEAMKAGLDFFAITDHSSFNIKANIIFGAKTVKYPNTEKVFDFWEDTKKIANDFNQNNYDAKTKSYSFIALAAYELTFAENTIGHINVFGTEICKSRTNYEKDQNRKPVDIHDQFKNHCEWLLKPEVTKAFIQLNHPVDQFGDFFELGYGAKIQKKLLTTKKNPKNSKSEEFVKLEVASLPDKKIEKIKATAKAAKIANDGNKIPLIELIHVDSEPNEYNILWDVYNKALENGWKVAPSFNPDNHHAGWGSANELRTVVLLPDKPAKLHEAFNQDNLFKAIRRRRVYATDCAGLQIDFRLKEAKDKSSKNLAVMGEITKTTAKNLNLYINVTINNKIQKEKDLWGEVVDAVSPTKITHYEIVGCKGEGLTSGSYAGGERMIELSRTKDCDYFYLKVKLSNNKFGVTAPIWINGNKEV